MSSSSSSRPRSVAGPVVRCPACGSRVRPAETWCSLCHHNLVTSATPKPAADQALLESVAQEPDAEVEVGPAEVGPGIADAGAGPAAADHEAIDEAMPAVAQSTADRLLAGLAADEAERARESRLHAWQNRFAGRSGAVILAVVGSVVLLVIGMLGLTLLGLFL
jgi:hypothetical protein